MFLIFTLKAMAYPILESETELSFSFIECRAIEARVVGRLHDGAVPCVCPVGDVVSTDVGHVASGVARER